MTTILLILMAAALVAALERNNNRQPLGAPGLSGSIDHDDRDWARVSLDLIALGDEAPTTTAPSSADRRAARILRKAA